MKGLNTELVVSQVHNTFRLCVRDTGRLKDDVRNVAPRQAEITEETHRSMCGVVLSVSFLYLSCIQYYLSIVCQHQNANLAIDL